MRDADADQHAAARLVDLQDQQRNEELRYTQNHRRIEAVQGRIITREDMETAMAAFDPVWDALCPREQARIIHLLIRWVEYDGEKGTVSITFRPDGIKTLTNRGIPA